MVIAPLASKDALKGSQAYLPACLPQPSEGGTTLFSVSSLPGSSSGLGAYLHSFIVARYSEAASFLSHIAGNKF